MSTGTIDMQLMRYINLFERITGLSTKNCFVYNNVLIFAVPKQKVFQAVGKNGENVKRMGEILRKKIKIISVRDEFEIDKFIEEIIDPVEVTKVEIKDGMAIITAGRQSKAALIGRGRVREQELENILNNFFRIKKIKII